MRAMILALILVGMPGTELAAADSGELYIVHFALGPAWDKGKPPNEQEGFAGHSQNLGRLRKQGVIALGARYGDLGMIVVRADSEEGARALVADDPGVAAGIFTYDVQPFSVFYPWQD